MDVNNPATWSRSITISTSCPNLRNLHITRENRSPTGHYTALSTLETVALVILLVELTLALVLLGTVILRRR